MISSPLVLVLCLAVLATYAVEAFVATIQAPSSSLVSSLVGPTCSSTSRPIRRTMVPAGCFGTRAAVTPSPRMAAYDDGASAGSGEIEMEMQELIVDFTDDGRILLEVKGVKGQECRQITEELIKALGDVITTENTAEYFEEKVVNVQKDAVKVGWTYDANKPEW